ncbi:hypothetical protein FRC17_003306 [Serendipita sp. 399]|nr:hypothetical protein FRC17_003306 [Serendipita sp. 399]
MAEVENTQLAAPSTLPHWSQQTGMSAQHFARSTDVPVGAGPPPTLRRPLAVANANAPLVIPTKTMTHDYANVSTQSKTAAFNALSLHACTLPPVQRNGDVHAFSRSTSIAEHSRLSQAALDTAIVGAIGDGRKRINPKMHLEPSLQSEMEQAASLLRSLDLTPPIPATGDRFKPLSATIDNCSRPFDKATNPEDEKCIDSRLQNFFDPFSSSNQGPPVFKSVPINDNNLHLPSASRRLSLFNESDSFLKYTDSGRLVPSELPDNKEEIHFQPTSLAVNLAPSTTKFDSSGAKSLNTSVALTQRPMPAPLARTVGDDPMLQAARSSSFIFPTHRDAPLTRFNSSGSDAIIDTFHTPPHLGDAHLLYGGDPVLQSPSIYWDHFRQSAAHRGYCPTPTSYNVNGFKPRSDGWVPSAAVDTPATYLTNGSSAQRSKSLLLQSQRPEYGSPAAWFPRTPLSRSEASSSSESEDAQHLMGGASAMPPLPTPRTSPCESVASFGVADEGGQPTRPSDRQFGVSAPVTNRSAMFNPLADSGVSSFYMRHPASFSAAVASPSNDFYSDLGARGMLFADQHKTQAHIVEDEELLQPNAKPPYHLLVHRIVKKSDQQASIFIQQKLKNAGVEERSRIVQAIAEKGLDMMQGRFGNWIVECMSGHIVELATNCYGTHVIQKALECEEDIKRIIVNELLDNEPAYTLTSKHCSHVWAKIMEINWVDGPAPPIFDVVNRSLRGKWASLACHETGSLVVQTIFENMDDADDKLIIVDEILANLAEVVKNQWGAFVIQHIIEHGDAPVSHRTSLSLISDLATYGTHDIAVKSILKILKEKDPVTTGATISKMCEPNTTGSRNKRPIIVDLALSANGSQVIQAVLPEANKDQRARLYEAIKGHTVTLRGCKTGSRVIWLFDRMRAYYGY